MGKVFRTKNNWTQKADCRDKNGKAVSINLVTDQNVKDIKSFSLQGAVSYYFSYERDPVRRYKTMDALRAAIQQHTGKAIPVAHYNDSPDTTFEDIKTVIKIADV